ncbi:MAG: hypothetical protein AAGG50_16105 [Bacteroidota bacterium]
MGQQQLLLLVLGIVIVGLAVVVGIQAFSENQTKANADAQVNDAIRIASDAQAWALKPTAFGGGNGVFNGLGTNGLAKLGYELGDNGSTPATGAADQYENLNGIYEITNVTNGTAGTNTGSFTIVGCNDALDTQVVMVVSGTTPADITTRIITGAQPCDFSLTS